MTGKLLLVLAAVVVAAVGAQACVEKYLEKSAPGEEGLIECCHVQFTLQETSKRYRGEEVVGELTDDLFKAIRHLQAHESGCGRIETCSKVGELTTHRDFSGAKWDDLQCHRWTKFERLCKLMKAKKSDDQQKLAIENWVCQVAKENVMELNEFLRERKGIEHECRNSIRNKALNEANKEFERVSSYTAEQLEAAKQALDQQIAPEKASKAAHDAQVTEEALKVTKDRIVNHLDEFKKCAAEREIYLDKHAGEIAARQQWMRDINKNFANLHRGYGQMF